MNLYRITATVIHHTNDSHCVSTDLTRQVPTFLLDADHLGIVSEEHAVEMARAIILPVELEYESVTVNAFAVKDGILPSS